MKIYPYELYTVLGRLGIGLKPWGPILVKREREKKDCESLRKPQEEERKIRKLFRHSRVEFNMHLTRIGPLVT